MTNANEPISPAIIEDTPFGGLTKREAFAMAAMQGLLAGNWGKTSVRDKLYTAENAIAELSIDFADALILELNKNKDK